MTRTEIQTALKQFRSGGHELKVKLTATTEALVKEYERLQPTVNSKPETTPSNESESLMVAPVVPVTSLSDFEGIDYETMSCTSWMSASPLTCDVNNFQFCELPKRKLTLTEIMERPLPEVTPEMQQELDELEELFGNKSTNLSYNVRLDGVMRSDNLSLEQAERLAIVYANGKEDREVSIYNSDELYLMVKESSQLVKQLKVYALRTDFAFEWISAHPVSPEMIEGGRLYVYGCLLLDQRTTKIWAFPTPLDALRFITKSGRYVARTNSFEEIWSTIGQVAINEQVRRFALDTASSFADMYRIVRRLNPLTQKQYKGFAVA